MKSIFPAFLSALLLSGLSASAAPSGHDILLGTPYALKATLPLLTIPGMIDGDVPVAAGVGLMTIATLPNSLVLIDAAAGNAGGTAFWRRVTFWCDAGMATAAGAMGAYALADAAFSLTEDNGWAGLGSVVYLTGAAAMAGLAYLDLKPFDFEGRGNLGVSAGIIPTRSGMGLAARLAYSF